LYPLTEEDNLPKALLPIANTPLIYFPLEWCQKAGFRGLFLRQFGANDEDVTVVCHTESLEQIKAYISSLSLSMEIKLEAPSSLEDNMGSADVIGLLKDLVTVYDLEIYSDIVRLHRTIVRLIHYTSTR